MPGSLRGAVAVGVFPNTLYRAFSESQPYLARLNEYHDGSSQRNPLVTGVRRSWRLAKRLTPAELATLRTFWLAHIGAAFYYYPDPRQYDATGVSTTGRYLVRFNSSWQESVGIALSDVPVELIELSATTGAGGEPPDGYPIAPPEPAGRTGVWMARPTVGVFDDYSNQLEGEWVSALNDTGQSGVTRTNPFRNFSVIYGKGPAGPPNPPGYSSSLIEQADVVVDFNKHDSDEIVASASFAVRDDGSTWVWPYEDGFWTQNPDGDNLVASASLGHRDDLADTIPDALLSKNICSVLWQTLNSVGYYPDDPAVFQLLGSYFRLYYNAVRVNCGGAALQAEQEDWGTYTWAADKGFTDGAAFECSGIGLFATGRKGASFRYTIGKDLFWNFRETVRHKVILGFAEHEYSSAGQRVFSVLANGSAKIANLDLYATSGNAAFTQDFEVEIANHPGGELHLDFEASVGEALVNHLIVMPMVPTGVLG